MDSLHHASEMLSITSTAPSAIPVPVDKVSSILKGVISHCVASLKEVSTTHTKILVGEPEDISNLKKHLDNNVDQTRKAVAMAKASYGSYDNGEIQQLLLKASMRLNQLEKMQKQVEVWTSPEGQQLVAARNDIESLLNTAHTKGINPAGCLYQAQKRLDDVVGTTKDPLLQSEIQHLQSRLSHQADRQLKLNSTEKLEIKSFTKNGNFGKTDTRLKKRRYVYNYFSKNYCAYFYHRKKGRGCWNAAVAYSGKGVGLSLLVDEANGRITTEPEKKSEGFIFIRSPSSTRTQCLVLKQRVEGHRSSVS